MKKFKLIGSVFINEYRRETSAIEVVEANNYDELIQEIESNAGWWSGEAGRFKVAFIVEVK